MQKTLSHQDAIDILRASTARLLGAIAVAETAQHTSGPLSYSKGNAYAAHADRVHHAWEAVKYAFLDYKDTGENL